MRRIRFLLPLFAIVYATAFAETETQRQTRRRAADAPIPDATINDVAFLAGRWTGTGLGGRTEEIWSPPEGGTMMGMFRLIRDDKPVFYEFLTLRQTDRGLAMQLKHLNPDMTGWEEREKFVEFLYVGKEGNRLYFEGLTIVRESDEALTMWLALKNKDGSIREETLKMQRSR